MHKLSRLGLIAIVVFACVGCDQVSKEMVRGHIALGHNESFLGDTIRLTHVENSGAFLSVGASLPQQARFAVFRVGVALILLALVLYALFARRLDAWSIGGLALLVGSGLGNLIDRMMQDGRVTDFLNVGFGPVRTGIFNVADVIGVIGFALLVLRNRPAR